VADRSHMRRGGATDGGRKVGTFGDLGTVSFLSRSPHEMGEGGAALYFTDQPI